MVKSAAYALQHGALTVCTFSGDLQNSEENARHMIHVLMHDSQQRKEKNVQRILGHRWRPDALQFTFCPSSD